MAHAGNIPTTSAKHLDVDEDRTQRYRHCSECGQNSYCTHPDDDDTPPPFDDNTDNITAVHQIIGPVHPSPSLQMLNPRNLSGLLTENVDEHATGYLIFTDHGTLLAYSDGTPVKFARKASALTALTWRLTEASMPRNTTQGPSVPAISAAPLKTIETAAANGGEELQMMVTEVDNMTLVVEYVKEKIVVAAMKESAEIYGGAKRADETENGSGGESVSSASAEGAESETSGGDGGSSTGTAAAGRAVSGSSVTASETGAENLTKLQILKLKTEGLRDALRVDLKDFRMPETFT